MYTPLNIKTDNYLQSSLIKIPDLIRFAKDNKLTSLTITDNNMYGVMDFYKACINNGIKPIIGLEVKISELEIILYAKNYIGYQNLIKITTIMSYTDLTINDLSKYCKYLVAIIPFNSRNLYNELKSIYEDLFLGYSNVKQRSLLKGDLVYINSIQCLYQNETQYLKYLEAIKEGITLNFIETNYSNNYLKLDDDILNIDLNNNEEIVSMCTVELPFNQDLMPKFNNNNSMDSYSYLKKMCIEGLKGRFGNSVSVIYQQRLKYELNVINNMGFCDYFLIVSDYVKYAKDHNIIVGSGRGSAVGSLVAYCLYITDVDPLKYDLLFERFLNPERVSMPDIDIDFEHEKRDEVINYCIEKYGEKRVAPIIAFGTLGSKQAIRDVSRCLDIDLKLVDNVCRMIDSTKNLSANYQNPKLRNYLKLRPNLLDMYNKAMHFEGLKRHTTIHAAGIIMSNTDLDEVIPLDKTHEFYTTAYDMNYLEEIGLLKMDFLAIKYLTTIHHIIDSINNHNNLSINFDDIPLNDEKAINIFKRADTIGIFQFESSGMIHFLKQLKPSTFDDIFAAIALFRPGPMKNIPSYIRRKEGKEKIDYLDPSLEKILKSTYGIMIYQEQIMQIANVMANYTLGEADILRKAMSKKKKDLLMEEEYRFKKRSIQNGYNQELVNKVFALMMKFAEYGFNKSHSVAYSIIAYKMAYLKAYYPEYFICELMSMEQGNASKMKKYLYEAKKYGIKINGPNINKSLDIYTIIDNDIQYPISHIKGINSSAVNTIVEERKKGLFIDIYDFIRRCYGKVVNKKVIESLILVGTFDGLGFNRKTLYENIDVIINYGELLQTLDAEYVFKPEIELKNEYTQKEMMSIELDYLGFYLTRSPVSDARDKYSDIIMLNEIDNYFNKSVKIAVMIDRIKEVDTKKGEKMAFVTGSDEFRQIDIVFFPKIYKEYKLTKGSIILLEGRVEKRYDEYQIIVQKVLDTTLQGSN